MDKLLLLPNLYLLFFALAYFVLFKNRNAPLFKRVYLLIALPLSFLLPLLSFNVFPVATVYAFQATLPEISVSKIFENTSSETGFAWLLLLYCFGVVSLISYHIIGFVKLKNVTKGAEKQTLFGIEFWYSSYIRGEFSTVNKIYSGRKNPPEEVLLHEQLHIEQNHSYDRFVFVALRILFWFNPVTYLLLEWSKENHEHLVDSAILLNQSVSNEQYVLTLKKEAVKAALPDWVIPFSQIKQLKNRLYMITKERNTKKTKRITILLAASLMLFVPFVNQSCSASENTKEEMTTTNEVVTEPEVVMPEFIGGQEAMFTFMGTNIKYPKEAEKAEVEGLTYVSFVITESGAIDKVSVKKGFNDLCDAEAVRVVKSMSNWKPGTIDGKAGSFEMTLPIKFTLK
jgi:TonB family protein